MSKFYLVQRLGSKKLHRADQGFDGYFSLDYMGSSEFEWGAIPKALKAMREQRVIVEPAKVYIDGRDHEVYFVGHKGVRNAGADMEAWARGDGHRRPFYGKEWTRFHEVLIGQNGEFDRTDAWWDIENNVAWAVDPDVADKLVDAFNSKPPRS